MQGMPEYQEDAQPPFYAVQVKAWNFLLVPKFASKESAEQFATTLQQSMRECSSIPARQATGAEPTLASTIDFVGEKLTTQGRVGASYRVVQVLPNGTKPPMNRDRGVEYFKTTPDPTTCTLTFDSVVPFIAQNGSRLSFRHISKIEVSTLKDYATAHDPELKSHFVELVDASSASVLNITLSNSQLRPLFFSDETTANRVAKAMVHAAELCGAGSKPEPF